MHHVDIDAVEPAPYDDDLHADRRPLSDALNTEGVAVTRYVLAPGERFSGAVHAHADQEEVFLVVAGTATFDTPDGEVVVGADEAVRFAPGEFQSGYNAGSDPLVAFALGAPRETTDVRVSRIPVLGDLDVTCPGCGRDAMRFPDEPGEPLECPDCDGTLAVE